ncbi:F-box family protein [Striga asiatica]|uniref:F-box family protein n=1 Tax=Striga asiatica TaxID=4170 RepID=A0A5A7PZU3_STRAF|nr:F-box family protein [Striga asiatica]
MGMLMLKNAARRSLFNSRYFFRNLSSIEHNPSLYIPKRHLQIDSTSSLLEKKLPLLLRKHGNNINTDGDVVLRCSYFSVLDRDDKSLSTRQLHLPFHSVLIQGSCNGVVCLEDKSIKGRLAFWNPSANEFKFLPPTCIQLHPDAKYLMFKGTNIGFDRNSQDFKVVRFVYNTFPEEHPSIPRTAHAELYSLNSDSWEELPDHLGSICFPLAWISASVNGVAYCETKINRMVRLLTFDFASKQFSFLDLPDSAKRVGSYYWLHLAERDGKLAAIIYPNVITYPNSEREKACELWVRSHDDGSWERVSTFCVPGGVKPLGFWTNDELLFQGRGEYLILFRLDTREVKHLSLNISDGDRVEFVPCVEIGVRLVGKSEFENQELIKVEGLIKSFLLFAPLFDGFSYFASKILWATTEGADRQGQADVFYRTLFSDGGADGGGRRAEGDGLRDAGSVWIVCTVMGI